MSAKTYTFNSEDFNIFLTKNRIEVNARSQKLFMNLEVYNLHNLSHSEEYVKTRVRQVEFQFYKGRSKNCLKS